MNGLADATGVGGQRPESLPVGGIVVIPEGEIDAMPPLTVEEARRFKKNIGGFVIGEARHLIKIISTCGAGSVSIRRSHVPLLIHALKCYLSEPSSE